MNIIQTCVNCEMGKFWIQAVHEDGRVVQLDIHPIKNGIIHPVMGFKMDDFPEIVESLEEVLA